MISDEQLIRFIDGQTSVQETEDILDTLAKDSQAMQEWLQMSHAASLADTTPAAGVSRSRARRFVASILERESRARRMLFPSLAMAAVAACIAVAIVVFKPSAAPLTEPLVAQVETAPAIAASLQEQEESAPAVAEASTPAAQQEVMEQQSLSGQIRSIAPAQSAHHDTGIATAASAVAVRYELKMLHPDKQEYTVRVSHPERIFNFRWEATGAVFSEILLTDAEGHEIARDSGEQLTEFGMSGGQLLSFGQVLWKVLVRYEDGQTDSRSGIVSFAKAKQ